MRRLPITKVEGAQRTVDVGNREDADLATAGDDHRSAVSLEGRLSALRLWR